MSIVYGKRFGGARDVYHLKSPLAHVAICGRLVDVTISFLPTGARVCSFCQREFDR